MLRLPLTTNIEKGRRTDVSDVRNEHHWPRGGPAPAGDTMKNKHVTVPDRLQLLSFKKLRLLFV